MTDTPRLAAERERDLAFFRARWPNIRAHDIPNWFADGAAHGRVEESKAHAQALEVLRELVEVTALPRFVKHAPRRKAAFDRACALLAAEDKR